MFQPGSSSDPWALEEQAEAKRKREKHEAKEFCKYHNMVSCYKMTCKHVTLIDCIILEHAAENGVKFS